MKRAEEEDEPEEERRAAALLRMLSAQTSDAWADESAAFGAILLPGHTAPVLEGPISAEQLDEHSKAALGLLAGVRLGQSGNTVVHVGARNGRGRLLAMLLPLLPAEMCDAPNSNGDTPLMFGAMGGHLYVAQCLIARGAVAGAANRAGMNPLMCACSAPGDCVELCTLILQHLQPSDVNAADINGNTALHFAARAGNVRCVHALLNGGADVTKRNRAGKTVLQAAQEAPPTPQSSECRALLQRRWKHLEVSADNAVRDIIEQPGKQRKGSRRRMKQKQKKAKAHGKKKPNSDKSETETNPANMSDQPSNGGSVAEEKEDKVSESESEEEISARTSDTTADITPADTHQDARSESQEPSLSTRVGSKRSSPSARKQNVSVGNTEQPPAKAKKPLAYADIVARSSSLTMPSSPSTRNPSPSRGKGKQSPKQMGTEAIALKRRYEEEKAAKEKLAVALEIARKEKNLIELERQILANELALRMERERNLERRLRESHPQAESLALTYIHLLETNYDDLSMEQISALQQIHSNALAGLRLAMERLMVKQEQILREEKACLQRELAALRSKVSSLH